MAKAVNIGTFTVDIIAYDLPKIAFPGEIVYVERPIDMYIGGHASNVSIDMIKLSVIKDVVAIGALGEDIFARIILDELRRYGVKVEPQIVKDVGTARNVILVVKGEDRRFHIYEGANPYLSHKHVLNSLVNLRPKYMYLALGVSKDLDENIAKVVKKAKNLGVLTLIDVAYVNEYSIRALRKIIYEVDVVHLNENELRMVFNIPKNLDLLTILKKLADVCPKLLTITLGGRGLTALTKKGKLIIQPSFNITPKDPTGAGDAFCAGILSFMELKKISLTEVSDEDLKELLLFAQASGASATLAAGATTAVSNEVVKELIDNQGKGIISSSKIINLK